MRSLVAVGSGDPKYEVASCRRRFHAGMSERRRPGSTSATPPMHPVHRGRLPGKGVYIQDRRCWEGPPPSVVTYAEGPTPVNPGCGVVRPATLINSGPSPVVYSVPQSFNRAARKKVKNP